MLLENRFTVPVPPDEVWNALVDVERVVVFLPGASLQSITGDHFEGRVKVKVGPITMSFKGVANFSLKDNAARRAVIHGAGKEIAGDGTAKGSMTRSSGFSGSMRSAATYSAYASSARS